MKFKNVSIVSTSGGLISIFCDHEGRGTKLYHEYFFLNKKHKLVAHFESTEALHVEQLSKEVEDIFHLSVTTWDKNKSKEKKRILLSKLILILPMKFYTILKIMKGVLKMVLLQSKRMVFGVLWMHTVMNL